MRLYLIVRRVVGDEDSSLEPLWIAETARKIRELAEKELGVEVVVDSLVDPDDKMRGDD